MLKKIKTTLIEDIYLHLLNNDEAFKIGNSEEAKAVHEKLSAEIDSLIPSGRSDIKMSVFDLINDIEAANEKHGFIKGFQYALQLVLGGFEDAKHSND